jgi:hypothetical protein
MLAILAPPNDNNFMSEFSNDLSYFNDDWIDQEVLDTRDRALNDPTNDYFLQSKPKQPKLTIGEYVAEHGIPVPLLSGADDVASAVDEGTLMIRSELEQDYSGLGGIFSSYVVDRALSRSSSDYQKQFNELIKDGLRSGELPPQEYMERFHPYSNWQYEESRLLEEALFLGLREMPIDLRVSTSTWRYVEGTNVTVFRDPNVEGRYHFGVTPPGQSVGDYRFDEGGHSTEQTFRNHKQPFIAEPFIEVYEQVRNLPLFDNTQAPVMELQQDTDGTIYFLQYRHVDKKINPTNAFELPHEGFRTNSVRGVTGPEGERVKLEINPGIKKKVPGNGIYGNQFFFRDDTPLKTQIVCKMAGVALFEDWLSFKDNHTSAASLILPRLAIGLHGADKASWPMLEQFKDLPRELPSLFRGANGEYFDVRVVSNGREAVLQSDWKIRRN